VKRLDLSEVVLTSRPGDRRPWRISLAGEAGPKGAGTGETLLADLGALAAGGRDLRAAVFRLPPAPGGRGPPFNHRDRRRMLRFPVHPRYARMFLAAQERGCVRRWP